MAIKEPERDRRTERSPHFSDRLLPMSILNGSADDLRSARVLLTGIGSAAAICVLFTLVHWSNGDFSRGAVSALSCLPIAGILGLLRLTGRTVLSVNLLLGFCTSIVAVSPFLAGEGQPALVALVIVPVAAALMGSAASSAVWTLVVTALLASYAAFFPFGDAERKVVWLTTIMAAGGGLAAALIEKGREKASLDAERAHEEAASDAENRLLAERALRESQALFGTAFRRSSSLMTLVSIETGRILEINESFVRTMGWSADEAEGQKVSDLNAWVNADDQERIFEAAMAKGKMESVEIRMRTKAGALVWLLGSVEVLKQDGLSCLLAEGVDITQRKENEEALAHYREQLEARFAEHEEQLQESLERLRERDQLAAVGTLAAGIAHQINNPIGGIVAATDLAAIMDDDPDREQIRTEALATANSEAKRVGRIVKNVLKFSRDEPTAKWVEDLAPTVRRATELARTHVTKRGGQLELGLSSSVLEVRASPIDIEQVILNLIYNASESKRQGADVWVQTLKRKDFAEITVSDNGDGIDSEARPNIFKPFFTSRIEEGGSGLGLSVVHGIVADHGGVLEVEDAPGGGTVVRVLLPLADERTYASTPSNFDFPETDELQPI